MRPGLLRHRIAFYSKVVSRDSYNASVESWPTVTVYTRCDIREVGGNKTLLDDERTYNKYKEVTIRYRNDINDTMKVQIDDTSASYDITYIEEVGNKEWLRISLTKTANDMVAGTVSTYSYLYDTTDLDTNTFLN